VLDKMQFLGSRPVQVLTLFIAVQTAAFYALSRPESAAAELTAPLERIPAQLGRWEQITNERMDARAENILHPDDYILRTLRDEGGRRTAHLFIAYFKTQRGGNMPHSPRNCLPGSGWVPILTGVTNLDVEGDAIAVNRNIVQKGDDRSVVIYWYQTPNRVVANEYWARVYLVTDSIRYNRTDTALVRVVAPVVEGDVERAYLDAEELARDVYLVLNQHIPAL
jgi:EpsI family protein